jgi:hypothetical protein
MQVRVARVIIIVVALVVVVLLRKFIKRLIFIIILLGVAFFLYGLFSPSGAAHLWYGIKTFPQRVASFFGGAVVLPYGEAQPSVVTPSPVEVPAESSSSKSEPLPSLPVPAEKIETPAVEAADSVEVAERFATSQRRASGRETFAREIREKIDTTVEIVEPLPVEPIVEPTVVVESPSPAPVASPPAPTSTKVNTSATASVPAQSTVSAGLSAQDIRDAEELWGMLSGRE